MIVVSNSTPLIALAAIDQLELLPHLFGQIYIPQAVYAEVVAGRRQTDAAREAVLSATWIKTETVRDRVAVQVLLDELDLGEAEAIVLASELSADWVLMDERKGRRKLAQLNLDKIGTLGILLKAKQQGLVTRIRPEIEKLQNSRFQISRYVIVEVLKQAGETEER